MDECSQPISTSPPSGLLPQAESGSPGLRRARWSRAAHRFSPWWGQCWNHQPAFPYRDDHGRHSDQYDIGSYVEANEFAYYPQVLFAHQHFCQPHAPLVAGLNSLTDPSLYSLGGAFNSVRMGAGWIGSSMVDPTLNYIQQSHTNSSSYSFSPLPRTPHGGGHKDEAPPCGYDSAQIPMSPFWGHLDQATLAMMGIASPHNNAPPQTPRRELTQQQRSDIGSSKLGGVGVEAEPVSSRQQHYMLSVRPIF